MARTKSNSFNRTVEVLDENFDFVEKPVTGTYTPLTSYEEALSAFGNDTSKILETLNDALRAAYIQSEMAKVTGGVEKRYVMQFIKPMRSTDDFKDLKEPEQTKKILEQVKTVPFLYKGLQSYCKNKAEEGDENE